jgi:hypothetical protein
MGFLRKPSMEYQYRAIPRTTFRMGWPNVRFARHKRPLAIPKRHRTRNDAERCCDVFEMTLETIWPY